MRFNHQHTNEETTFDKKTIRCFGRKNFQKGGDDRKKTSQRR
jgi:hypothetical protein